MGKLDGKVAVITGGTTGMALAGAKLFVDEGAHVFITGRRQDALEAAVKQIGRNVTGVQGDAADLDDLDRLYDTVKREKGSLDVLWASAGGGEPAPLGEITEAQFDTWFGLNARGTLFTVQKALPPPSSPAARWATPTRSPPPRSSSPPTTPATSTAWNSSPTAAPPPSKPNSPQPGQDIS
jgi:NAD(P)-dependent dehydrogenase (short-subunit alcohol dehydrogenase family)